MYSVITNSTYDGLCYNARRVEELLDPSVDRIHFDEAWYAYARFNPIYRDRYAMHGDPKDHKGPTVFATHSTHKLLAALSQASLLHIRDGRSPIPHARFNESYMMQASHLAALHDHRVERHDGGDDGRSRRVGAHQRVHRGGGGVPADRWAASTGVREEGRLVLQHLERGPGQGRKERQEGRIRRTRRPSSSRASPTRWVLHPGDTWHGFGDIEDGYCMLDPIKVSIVTPGVADKGGLDKRGHPGHARDGVSPPPRCRGREDDGLHDPLPLLDRHHQGQVGDAAQRAARLQARLRQQLLRWPKCCPT